VTQTVSNAEASPSDTRTPDNLRFLSSPWVLPILLIITFAVFAPTLNTWFMADDFWLLRSSQTTPVGKFFVQAFDYRDVRPVPQFGFYRPLYVISFRLCYAAFGQHALLYHALNIILHLGSVVLVWVIARRLLRSGFGANAAAAVFALHPAYTQSLVWIARGNTLMVTFVYLLTMLAFMNYVDGGRRRHFYYIASVLGFAAAALYHTTALSLAAVLPGYVFLVARTPSDALRPRWWLRLAPFVAIAIVMLVIRQRAEVEAVLSAFKVGSHQYAAYGGYLGLALFPVVPDDWVRLHLPMIALVAKLQLAASLAMIGATLVLLDRREWPYRGVFVVWWLCVALIPNSTSLLGVAPAQLYLPGASLGIFFVLVMRRINELLPARFVRRASNVAPLALMALLVSAVYLNLVHERPGAQYMRENQSFISRLRETVPPLSPGSTLYIVDPPINLVVFNFEVALDASVELYYGDVTVHNISAEKAAQIRAADPAALIFDNSLSSQR
jgi:hypothetical protein